MQERPRLPRHLIWYWEAFNRLSQSRGSSGFGPSPISVSQIKDYCDIYGIQSADEVCKVVDYIQAMDRVFLEEETDDPDEDIDNA